MGWGDNGAIMKKTFKLNVEGKHPDRVLEAVKHEIRKYVKRQRRVPLPTYPFERQRYWVEPDKGSLPAPATAGLLRKQPDVADWFSTPTWRRSLVPSGQVASAAPLTWLVVHDGDARAAEVMGSLAERGHRVVATGGAVTETLSP